MPGTINALVVPITARRMPLLGSPITRSTYRNILERFRGEHGDKRVAMLRRKDVVAMLAAKAGDARRC